jgi:hypothetical protein
MGSTPKPAAYTWSVTCTITIGSKTFDGSGSVVVTSEHAIDPTPGNNSNTGSDSTEILASADAQIVSWVFPDELGSPGNQVLVVPGVAENTVATETLDNNGGTYTGASINVSIGVTKTAGANCAATADSGNPNSQTLLMDGTDVVDTLTWSVTLSSPANDCTIDFVKTITITTSGVIDSHLDDNTASRSVILVADTDGDTVPNNYGVLDDNCDGIANPGQANSDGDTLGDVCDNCPLVANQDQKNTDGDTLGDACDPDDDDDVLDDGDGGGPFSNPSAPGETSVCDDNCRLIPKAGQQDEEPDGIGNVCELDVNCDNDLDIEDALMILDYIRGRVDLDPTQCPAPGGDLYGPRASAYVLDPGGVGTIGDVLMILQCILAGSGHPERHNIVCPAPPAP